MSVSRETLPERSRGDFERLCSEVVPAAELDASAARMLAHYETLRTWAQVHDLIGPGTYDSVLERHYAEALAGVDQLPESGTLVDLGSGAGFPGFVLACVRPRLRVILVEPRAKRVAFLRAAARAARLAVEVHAARLPLPLPPTVPASLDVVTVRALRVDSPTAAALIQRLRRGGRWLAWVGQDEELPRGLVRTATIPLPGRSTATIAVGQPV